MAHNDFFIEVQAIMKSKCMWFEKPTTIKDKLVNAYYGLRIFITFVMILIALSQLYFYGMSYLLHDSFCLVPLGVLSLVASIHTALNFRKIVESVAEYKTLIESFPDEEKTIINKELEDNRKNTKIIVLGLDYYIYGTIICYSATITTHYFFGIPAKPVVLPFLYEKLFEGNIVLEPMLVFAVYLSMQYIVLLSSFSGYIAVSLYVIKCTVGIIKALRCRMELITKTAGDNSEKLLKSMELGDTVIKHGRLLQICDNMVSWNAFPLVSVANFCMILFCMEAITFKQAMGKNDYSTAGVWGSFLVFCCLTLYILCSHGQEVENESEELLAAIYGLPWYRESPKTRKDVVVMIAQGNRLIKISYMGMVDINMVKFLDVVQTAYSYFTILSSVNG